MKILGTLVCSVAVTFFACGSLWAQVFPDRPIKLVVPTPAGVAPDVVARLLSVRLEQPLGKPVVVDNKPGASGIIGTDSVAKAPADGYTLLYGYNQLLGINPHLFSKLPYKAGDFVPISLVARTGYLILVNPNSPIQTIQDLIAAAKAKPRTLSYGSQGMGTVNHLIMELMSKTASIEMLHVPYSNGMALGLMAGNIDLSVEPNGSGVPFAQTGKLRAIAVTSKERLKSLPNVPTVSESIPGFVVEGWHAIWAPRGLPQAVQQKLNKEITDIVKTPEFAARIVDLGLTTVASTPEALDAALAEDSARWSAIIKQKNIRLD